MAHKHIFDYDLLDKTKGQN